MSKIIHEIPHYRANKDNKFMSNRTRVDLDNQFWANSLVQFLLSTYPYKLLPFRTRTNSKSCRAYVNISKFPIEKWDLKKFVDANDTAGLHAFAYTAKN